MVQILLSTYNGDAYLQPLLDSVLAQDYREIELLARDDGSGDDTMAILRVYAAASSNVTILYGKNLGLAQSFFQLLEHSSPTADYLAFCDQDDVWQSDKVSRAVEWLQRVPPETPALYCSRVAMVDANLQVIRLTDAPRRGLSFRNALVEPVVWGCTSVINRAARNLLLRELPACAWAHDRWIYLVISGLGTVLFDNEPRILHRRHGKNTSLFPLTINDRWRVQLNRFFTPGLRRPVMKQAEEFSRIHGCHLSTEHKHTLERFLGCGKRWQDRLRYALSCDVYHQSRLGNLMLKGLIVFDRLY